MNRQQKNAIFEFRLTEQACIHTNTTTIVHKIVFFRSFDSKQRMVRKIGYLAKLYNAHKYRAVVANNSFLI